MARIFDPAARPALIGLLFIVCLFVPAPDISARNLGTIVPPRDQINDNQARIALAGLLASGQDPAGLKEAEALLSRVEREAPGEHEVNHIRVSILLKLGQYEQALDLALRLAQKSNRPAESLALLADAYAAMGNYAACERIYRELSQAQPNDRELALRRADRLNLWGDFQGVEKAYRDRLALKPDDHPARLALARVLFSRQRYEESTEVISGLLRGPAQKDPAFRRDCLLVLTDVRRMEKDYAGALALLDRALENDPQFAEALAAKGEILLLDQRPAEAEAVFEQLAATDRKTLAPRILLGWGRSLLEQNKNGQAETVLLRAVGLSAPNHAPRFFLLLAHGREPIESADQENPQTLAAWGDLYASLADHRRAAQCYESALLAAPDHFPARLGLAQTLASTSDYDRALEELDRLARDFPQSWKLSLTKARILAWSRRYDQSLAAYSALRSMDPQDPVPTIEAARTAYWAKNPGLGDELYLALQTPSVDERLAALLPETIPAKAPPSRWSKPLPYKEYENLRYKLPSLPQESRDRAESALDGLEAEYGLQKAARLEQKAKQEGWNGRFARSIRTLDELLAHRPGNEEALFDLGQSQCALGLCDRERETYKRLLRLDPAHALAALALERTKTRSNPAIKYSFSLWDEEGRGELSQIRRTSNLAGFEVPLSGQHRVGLSSGYYVEAPKQYGELRRAFGQSVEWRSVLNPYISFSGQLLSKWWDGPPRQTTSGRADLRINAMDYFILALNYERREEFSNAFALRQGVMSDRLGLDLETRPFRRLGLNLGYEHIFYNDDNQGLLATAGAKILLSDHPRTLSLSLDLEHRHTQKENTFHYNEDNDEILENITHPYWTPRDYLAGGLTLEWRHDLSRHLFCGSELHYYDIKLSVGTDSDENPYFRAAGAWRWEFLDHWTLDVEAMSHYSEDWTAAAATAGLSYRF